MQPDNKKALYNDRFNLLNGKGLFDFRKLASTSVNLLKSNFWPIFQACALIILVVFAFAMVISGIYPIEQLTAMPAEQQGILDIAMILIVAPLSAGLSLMGVNIARGNRIKTSDVFRYLSWVLPLALAQLLVTILVQIGLTVLILPGLYLFVATTFTLPLIADKKLGVLQAIITSCKAVNQFILSFIVLFVIFLVLFLLSIFTFGLAFLVIMPLYFVVTGMLYTTLFDTAENHQVNESAGQESTFDA